MTRLVIELDYVIVGVVALIKSISFCLILKEISSLGADDSWDQTGTKSLSVFLSGADSESPQANKRYHQPGVPGELSLKAGNTLLA